MSNYGSGNISVLLNIGPYPTPSVSRSSTETYFPSDSSSATPSYSSTLSATDSSSSSTTTTMSSSGSPSYSVSATPSSSTNGGGGSGLGNEILGGIIGGIITGLTFAATAIIYWKCFHHHKHHQHGEAPLGEMRNIHSINADAKIAVTKSTVALVGADYVGRADAKETNFSDIANSCSQFEEFSYITGRCEEIFAA